MPAKSSSDKEEIHNLSNDIVSQPQEKNSKAAKKLKYGDKEVSDTKKEIDASLTTNNLGSKKQNKKYMSKNLEDILKTGKSRHIP